MCTKQALKVCVKLRVGRSDTEEWQIWGMKLGDGMQKAKIPHAGTMDMDTMDMSIGWLATVCVTSSSGYSSSSEVKAGSSEVRGFLELASARVLRIPSVMSRVFRTEVRIEFPEHAGTEKCTGMVPSTSTKM